jgi:hypothetical protein
MVWNKVLITPSDFIALRLCFWATTATMSFFEIFFPCDTILLVASFGVSSTSSSILADDDDDAMKSATDPPPVVAFTLFNVFLAAIRTAMVRYIFQLFALVDSFFPVLLGAPELSNVFYYGVSGSIAKSPKDALAPTFPFPVLNQPSQTWYDGFFFCWSTNRSFADIRTVRTCFASKPITSRVVRNMRRVSRHVLFAPPPDGGVGGVGGGGCYCLRMRTAAAFIVAVVVGLTVLSRSSFAVHDDEQQYDAIVILAHDMIGGEENSSSSIGIPVSPSCWASAMMALLGPSSPVGTTTTDAASFCANLPETSQKRLALELARCHLEDMQKPLFHSHGKAEECSKTSPMLLRSTSNESSALRSCLAGLTDAGEHAYTHYMPYLQALCIRKTQELFLRHQQSIKDDLAAEYAKMSRTSIEHMESVQQSTARHAAELNVKLADMPLAIQNQLADQLSELIGKELGERLAQAMEQQTNQQSEAFSEILTNIQLQDLQRQQQHDDWGHYQAGMFLKQAQEMERQRDALRESRERIEDLSSKVSETSMTMQPLVGLEAFMKAVTEGYSWISFLLYFLATFNVVWVMTRPERCHRFRLHIFAVVITEAVMELALKGAVTHGLFDEVDRLGWTTELRRLALLLECIAYLVGLLMSFFATSTDSVDKERILDALMDRHRART